MPKPRILVTRRWPQAVEDLLEQEFDADFNIDDRALSPDELRIAMTEYDAILPTVTDRLGPEAFPDAAPRVQILANYGVGFSHIDTEAARRLGVAVTNTPDVLSDCTADLAMTLLLMAARRAGEGERELRAGDWSGWRPTHLVGSKVTGKTLGIIGFGRIGREMARRAHHGFGMRILVQNRSRVDPTVLAEFGATQVASVEDLLPECDFVSLHCPGGDANRHLINAERLALMRGDAYLINTARGEVIHEEDLAKALTEGRIGGAALDVFEGEPAINPTLACCDRLVMLPHLGSATRETREGMGLRALENLRAFFAGQEPPDRVA
ncbi:D-glycerate dehydrogenase [Brevirhabdus pacifica]|uniref:D-glycerate dehydrogenase n=1 Tax=Brevirhabdus pacifica TaxID=1267768 RepID=A0A1U7DIT3_9RHOB|nr:D-glycerate dehydrogenase [Brevirhabdus pacifica]APX89793.1 D-glycerate dehydrogenase [Brevirhabdus pacifica]OWU74478.1 2-hydroxyacid dehydrogenase [Loktanella sp. 22II-4b]PJJ82999.1 glyoxylate reductase [Brevirhabdus pacifica]